MPIYNLKYAVASVVLLAICSPDALAQQPAAATPSIFEQMLASVYERNPKLDAEREAVAIADEHVSQAVAGYRPTLTANGGMGRQREKVAGEDWQYGQATSGSLSAVQPIFNGFGTLAQRRAADQRVLAARARLLAVEQSVLLAAITDWLEICEKEKVLSLTEDDLHSMYQYFDATRQRYKAGDGTQTDVSQSESRMAQAEAKQAIAEAERNAARAAFERDTGLVPEATDFPPLPVPLPKDMAEAETMAKNNPEMHQAAYEEKAADEDIEAAKSSLWPSVYLRAGMDEEHSPTLGLDRFRNDSVTLNVSIPLYQGGGEYSRIREAKLAHAKTIDDAMDLERDLIGRARFSWFNYQSAQTVISASSHATAAATQALTGIQEEQRQGLRTLTDVLDEQTEVLNTQISETQAQENVRLEAYRLLAATGGLTAEALHLPVKSYEPQEHYDDISGRWAGLSSDVPMRPQDSQQ